MFFWFQFPELHCLSLLSSVLSPLTEYVILQGKDLIYAGPVLTEPQVLALEPRVGVEELWLSTEMTLG